MAKRKTNNKSPQKTTTTVRRTKKKKAGGRRRPMKPSTGGATALSTKPTESQVTSAEPVVPGRSKTGVIMKLTHDQIARRAYEIWLAKGRPLGQDEQNWQEAIAQLTRAAGQKR